MEMPDAPLLMTLQRSEAERLEKLRRLENRLTKSLSSDEPAIHKNIEMLMDDIAQISRAIQAYKARQSFAG
jgi:Na+/phosphate symporter